MDPNTVLDWFLFELRNAASAVLQAREMDVEALQAQGELSAPANQVAWNLALLAADTEDN